MEWFIAHQGGWDEALMFIVPIAIAVGAVKWAEKRGVRKREELEDVAAETPPHEGGA